MPSGQRPQACGLCGHWLKRTKKIEHAKKLTHIIQFDGLAYLFIFWDKMCGLHLTYFKSEIQTEGLFLDASEA